MNNTEPQKLLVMEIDGKKVGVPLWQFDQVRHDDTLVGFGTKKSRLSVANPLPPFGDDKNLYLSNTGTWEKITEGFELATITEENIKSATHNVAAGITGERFHQGWWSKFVDGVVSTAKLASSAVTSGKILDGAVITSKITDNAVTVAKLPTGATASTYLRGDGTWATPSNTYYTYSAADKGGLSLSSYAFKIKADSGSVADTSLTSSTAGSSGRNYAVALSSDTGTPYVTVPWNNDNTTYSTISEAEIKSNSDTNARLITGQRFATGWTANFTDGIVSTAKLADSAVTTAKIAANAVTVAKLPTGATSSTYLRGDGTWATPTDTNTTYSEISETEVSSSSDTTTRLITGRRFATGWTAKFTDGIVSTAKLADSAVTNVKIADGTVMPAKLNKAQGGTAGSSTFYRGDGAWATPANTDTTYSVIAAADLIKTDHTTGALITGQRFTGTAANALGGTWATAAPTSTQPVSTAQTSNVATHVQNLYNYARWLDLNKKDGTVTSVAATTNGLITIGGTATTTPTVGISSIAANNVIGNNTSSAAVPAAVKVVAAMMTSASGDSGKFLKSNGTSAPEWATAGTGTVTSVGISGTDLTVSNSPITGSGTITITHPTDHSARTVAFTAASANANIATGETLAVMTGKLAKWYSDFGTTTANKIILGNGEHSLKVLADGTSGQVLTSQGSSAPTWTTISTGSGTVTSVSQGNGMSFTAITGSGSVSMATPLSCTDSTTNSAGTAGNGHSHAITGFVTGVTATSNGLAAVAGTTTAPTVGLASTAANTLIGNGTSSSAVPTALTAANAIKLLASVSTTANSTDYILARGTSDSAWTFKAMPAIGTVTKVSPGNGMNFTEFTATGTVTLATPLDCSTTTASSSGTGSAGHTHKIVDVLTTNTAQTVTGKKTFGAAGDAAATQSPFNLPHRTTAPTAWTNGDIWTNSTSIMARIDGNTRTVYHSGNLPTVAASASGVAPSPGGTANQVLAMGTGTTTAPSFQKVTAAMMTGGTSGQFLKSNGTSAPEWAAPPTVTASVAGYAPGPTSSDTSVVLSKGTGTTDAPTFKKVTPAMLSATGTASATTYYCGNGSWATPANTDTTYSSGNGLALGSNAFSVKLDNTTTAATSNSSGTRNGGLQVGSDGVRINAAVTTGITAVGATALTNTTTQLMPANASVANRNYQLQLSNVGIPYVTVPWENTTSSSGISSIGLSGSGLTVTAGSSSSPLTSNGTINANVTGVVPTAGVSVLKFWTGNRTSYNSATKSADTLYIITDPGATGTGSSNTDKTGSGAITMGTNTTPIPTGNLVLPVTDQVTGNTVNTPVTRGYLGSRLVFPPYVKEWKLGIANSLSQEWFTTGFDLTREQMRDFDLFPTTITMQDDPDPNDPPEYLSIGAWVPYDTVNNSGHTLANTHDGIYPDGSQPWYVKLNTDDDWNNPYILPESKYWQAINIDWSRIPSSFTSSQWYFPRRRVSFVVPAIGITVHAFIPRRLSNISSRGTTTFPNGGENYKFRLLLYTG